MALQPCRECKKDVAATAKTCPHCGVDNPATSSGINIVGSLITVAAMAAMAWYLFGGGLDQQAAEELDDIYGKVAQDAVQQYGITARSGTPIDKCVHAGLVAAAYLQAKQDAEYARWKQTEASDCRAAGMPSP